MPATKKWWFFRFRGLSVTDAGIDLQNLTFQDCDLISENDLLSTIASPTDDINMLTAFVQNPQLRLADSYLVVSRMVPNFQDLKIAEEKAFERARIVAALISMCFLSTGNMPMTCGLTREVNDNFYDAVRFDNPGWNFNFEHRGRVQYTRPAQAISRAQLLAMFQHFEFKALAAAILGPNCPLTGRMRLRITSSLLRLASGVWANEAESLLLGAFTSMEMLLGEGSHDTLISRVTTLLGKQLSTQLLLGEVTQSRHNYVHRGHSVTIDVGLTAVALGFATLLTYCRFASSLPKAVCNSDLINLFVDLRTRVPPVSAEQLALLFQNVEIDQFRTAIPFKFHQPVPGIHIQMPASHFVNQESSEESGDVFS